MHNKLLLLLIFAYIILHYSEAVPNHHSWKKPSRKETEQQQQQQVEIAKCCKIEIENLGNENDERDSPNHWRLSIMEKEGNESEENKEQVANSEAVANVQSAYFRNKRDKNRRRERTRNRKNRRKLRMNVKKQRNSKRSRVGFKNKPKRSRRPLRRKLNTEQSRIVKRKCRLKPGGCRKQSAKSKARKEKSYNLKRRARRRSAKKRKGNRELNSNEERAVDEEVELEMNKTFEAKKALLKAQGFSEDEVIPNDDGTWAGDTFLTIEQAERIVVQQKFSFNNELVPPVFPDKMNAMKRKKRYALFLEENLAARWEEMPIKYVIDEDFDETERLLIKAAIHDIESKTCINFLELTTEPDDSSYIKYVREDYASFCGLSYLGHKGDENTIWLNMADCLDQMKGTAAHETMHALGVVHQQTRYDRNSYINVSYSNIDPQDYDFFEAGDVASMSGYGVPYDYYSVMHYNAYVATNDPELPSMNALKEPADFFTEFIPSDCLDLEVWCGWWATDGFCDTSTKSMIEFCPKSCGFCPLGASERANKKLQS